MGEETVKFRRERESLKKNFGVPVLSVGHSQTNIAEALYTNLRFALPHRRVKICSLNLTKFIACKNNIINILQRIIPEP